MSWLSKREKLDPVQASAIDFAVAQEGNFYIKGEAGTGWMRWGFHGVPMERNVDNFARGNSSCNGGCGRIYLRPFDIIAAER